MADSEGPFALVAGSKLYQPLHIRAFGVFVQNFTAQYVQVAEIGFIPPNTSGSLGLNGTVVAIAKFAAPPSVSQPIAIAGQVCSFIYTEAVLPFTGGPTQGSALASVMTLERFLRANIPAPGSAGRLIELIDYDKGLWIDDGTNPLWSVTGQIVNVRAYGARGDGVTDDSAAIQNAINAAEVTYFPPGTYQCAAGFTMGSDRALIGAGMGQVTIRGASLAGAVLGPTSTAGTRYYRWRIVGINIDNTSRATVGGIGIDLTNITDAYLENVTVSNVETGVLLRGNGGLGGGLYNRLIDVAASTTSQGFLFDKAGGAPGPNEATLIACRVIDSTGVAGFNINAGNSIHLFGCAVETFLIGVRCNDAGAHIFAMRFEGGTTAVSITAAGSRTEVIAPYMAAITTNYLLDASVLSDTIFIGDMQLVYSPFLGVTQLRIGVPIGGNTFSRLLNDAARRVKLRNDVDTGYDDLHLRDFLANRHFTSDGGTPALSAVNANIGANSIAGTDAAMRFSFTTGGVAPGAGADLVTITFSVAYTAAPAIVVSESSGNLAGFGVYLPAAGSFHVITLLALVALTAYTVDIITVGLQA